MPLERKIVGDINKICTNIDSSIVCREITAFVKSKGNLETGRVVNKFQNVEFCYSPLNLYLIITEGTIGSTKQTMTVENYSSMEYLRPAYERWTKKITKQGYVQIDVLSLDIDTCSPYARNFLAQQKVTMSADEAMSIVQKNKSKGVITPVQSAVKPLDKKVSSFVNTIYKEANMLVKEYLDPAHFQGTGTIASISKRNIDCGRQVLDSIMQLVNARAVSQGAESDTLLRQIADLSNQYNALIPRVVKTRGKFAWCLSEPDLIIAQYEFLDTLEMLIASSVVDGNKSNVTTEQYYKMLNCDIEYVTDKCIYSQIEEKLKREQLKGHNFKTRLLNVYAIRQHNAPAFDASCGNVVSLFHGTGASNLFGILSTSLRVPPKTGTNIHITGRMFGDGIYLGEYSKALQYSTRRFGGSKNKCPSYFLLLCDAALGSIYMQPNAHYYTAAPRGYNSVMGVGRDILHGDCVLTGVGATKTLTLPKASVLKQMSSSSLVLVHNEFIVYSPNRVRISYIVEVEQG